MTKQKKSHIQSNKNTNMNKSHSQLYDEGMALYSYILVLGNITKAANARFLE